MVLDVLIEGRALVSQCLRASEEREYAMGSVNGTC